MSWDVKTGMRFGCEMADFDACDEYGFVVDAVGDEFTVTWTLEGCPDTGTMSVPAAALENGRGLIFISQGGPRIGVNALEGSRSDTHLPAFLMPRAIVRRAKAGESVPFDADGEECEITLTGKTAGEIEVDGQPVTVDVLTLGDADGKVVLQVADHPTWPLVIRMETFGGDNHVALLRIATR